MQHLEHDHTEPTVALTPQRRVVLEVIRETEAHLPAVEIFDLARRRLSTISFATVYNSLRYLKQMGLIAEIGFAGSASRYDRETTRHDHALCSRCNTPVDFDLPEAAGLIRAAARETNFAPEMVYLTLVGVCRSCRSETQEAP